MNITNETNKKPTNTTDIKVCVIGAMRILRLIPITSIQPPTVMKWAEAVKIYLKNLPGKHITRCIDDYSPDDENIFQKKLSRKYNRT